MELLLENEAEDESSEEELWSFEREFRIGEFDIEIGYYMIYRGVILDDRDIYFHEDYEPDLRHFVVEINKLYGASVEGQIFDQPSSSVSQ